MTNFSYFTAQLRWWYMLSFFLKSKKDSYISACEMCYHQAGWKERYSISTTTFSWVCVSCTLSKGQARSIWRISLLWLQLFKFAEKKPIMLVLTFGQGGTLNLFNFLFKINKRKTYSHAYIQESWNTGMCRVYSVNLFLNAEILLISS